MIAIDNIKLLYMGKSLCLRTDDSELHFVITKIVKEVSADGKTEFCFSGDIGVFIHIDLFVLSHLIFFGVYNSVKPNKTYELKIL